jgi:hypothetical protein
VLLHLKRRRKARCKSSLSCSFRTRWLLGAFSLKCVVCRRVSRSSMPRLEEQSGGEGEAQGGGRDVQQERQLAGGVPRGVA